MDINDNGEIVGYSDRQTGYFHGFVWSEKTGMTDIGALSDPGVSFAMAINNKGQVVGMGRLSGMYQPMILWTEQEGLEMIGTFPGENYASPVAINEQGQAVGSAADGSTFSAFMYSIKLGSCELEIFPVEIKALPWVSTTMGLLSAIPFFPIVAIPTKKFRVLFGRIKKAYLLFNLSQVTQPTWRWQ
jgi:probable HAF family extracellular repeat protein